MKTNPTTSFGEKLRYWRGRRGISQLELALRANASSRHISFLETGRSRPGREFIHRVAEAMDIPMRERNALLLAAGLSADYGEAGLEGSAGGPYRAAIDMMLAKHEPFPAFVMDRWWNLVDANESAKALFIAPISRAPGDQNELNLVDAFLGPGPWRDMVENWRDMAIQLLGRIRRETAEAGPDPRFVSLLERAEKYTQGLSLSPEPTTDPVVVCPRIRIGDQVIETISMVARFFAVRDVRLDELRVELIYPSDEHAANFFRARVRGPAE